MNWRIQYAADNTLIKWKYNLKLSRRKVEQKQGIYEVEMLYYR